MRADTNQITFNDLLNTCLSSFAVVCLLSTGFFGVGIMGCYGAELIASSQQWRTWKNISMGSSLVSLSGFLGVGLITGTLRAIGVGEDDGE